MNNKAIVLGVCLLAANTPFAVAQAPVSSVVDASTLEQRLQELERLVNSRTSAQHRIQNQLDTVQDEVNELRGSIEVHNHKLEKILERQRELYLEIDKRIEAVLALPTQATAPPVAEPVTPGQQALSADENAAYDRAVNLILKDKRYEQAIPEFEAFLQQFPNSSYAPNAHYWLGQLQFNKKEWAKAAEQFDRVVRFHPDSFKRPDSLLKLGVIAQKQNNLARANQLFEQVISEYPDSSVRKLAEQRLRAEK